jgi:hypothetical protein
MVLSAKRRSSSLPPSSREAKATPDDCTWSKAEAGRIEVRTYLLERREGLDGMGWMEGYCWLCGLGRGCTNQGEIMLTRLPW